MPTTGLAGAGGGAVGPGGGGGGGGAGGAFFLHPAANATSTQAKINQVNLFVRIISEQSLPETSSDLFSLYSATQPWDNPARGGALHTKTYLLHTGFSFRPCVVSWRVCFPSASIVQI